MKNHNTSSARKRKIIKLPHWIEEFIKGIIYSLIILCFWSFATVFEHVVFKSAASLILDVSAEGMSVEERTELEQKYSMPYTTAADRIDAETEYFQENEIPTEEYRVDENGEIIEDDGEFDRIINYLSCYFRTKWEGDSHGNWVCQTLLNMQQ